VKCTNFAFIVEVGKKLLVTKDSADTATLEREQVIQGSYVAHV
jgi:hypothetical protein